MQKKLVSFFTDFMKPQILNKYLYRNYEEIFISKNLVESEQLDVKKSDVLTVENSEIISASSSVVDSLKNLVLKKNYAKENKNFYVTKNESVQKLPKVNVKVLKNIQMVKSSALTINNLSVLQVPHFPILDASMNDLIEFALSPGNSKDIMVTGFGLQITRGDLHTLSGLNWLNDEVINFYMNLSIQRGFLNNFRKTYAMNTFFTLSCCPLVMLVLKDGL